MTLSFGSISERLSPKRPPETSRCGPNPVAARAFGEAVRRPAPGRRGVQPEGIGH
jgi:hypothetical protein